ncbi:hypothetical protein F7O00_05085 [Campylobacter coli]|nr:hypothetical protein [Campylobacter coli]
MADMIDSGKISFACELDKDLETPTTESNTEARITFTETQIVLGLGNDKSIKYKATGQGTNLSNYYNKSQVDEKLKLKADKTQLGDYYNKSEIDTSLSTKVDTTTLTTNHYNKTETDNLLNKKADKTVLENYYNKSDIDGKLINKVDTTTLDNYDLSTEVDNKVKVVSDKVGDLSTLETGVKNTVVSAINEVKRAQTEAGKVTNLNDLGDVNASAPRRGQFLGWDQDTSKWVSKDVETDGMNTHMSDVNNPHKTTISNLNDTTINTPKVNQVLAYNGTKWINKDVSLDDSNYAKKNEANIFTKRQSGIDGTEDANFVTLKQLKTKVGLTGNETIAGIKTFSSPIIIPNATYNNHSLPLGQADGRYGQLLTKNLTLTVGSGVETSTHFNTLEKAINEALKYTKQNNLTITIALNEDLTLTKGLTFTYCDCRNIIIDGKNHTIQKEMTSNGEPMFYALHSTFLPVFKNITFKNTGSNSNGICFVVHHNSNLNLHSMKYTIDNFFIGVRVAASSFVNIANNFTDSKIKNCQTALHCFALGEIEARGIILEGNSTGILLGSGAIVLAGGIKFVSNTINCNIAFNTLTQQGICFK